MYEMAIKAAGLEIKEIHNGATIMAEAETGRGKLSVICGKNGTARVDKPNGSHKWYYEKTPAQIYSILRQTIDCNK